MRESATLNAQTALTKRVSSVSHATPNARHVPSIAHSSVLRATQKVIILSLMAIPARMSARLATMAIIILLAVSPVKTHAFLAQVMLQHVCLAT